MTSREHGADVTITHEGLTKIRTALYNAKHCIESGFAGEDRAQALRSIIEALDVASRLSAAPGSVVPRAPSGG